MTEEEQRKNFEKCWVRPLQELLIEEQAQEEIMDIQCQTLAKAVTMTTKEVEHCPEKHAKKWDSGIKKELDSLRTRDVFEELTTEDAYHTYWKHHIKTKKLPSQVVFTRKPDELDDEGWKAKARVCACGNFETHTIGKDQNNRAEVPDIFELRLLLALAASAKHAYSARGVDQNTGRPA